LSGYKDLFPEVRSYDFKFYYREYSAMKKENPGTEIAPVCGNKSAQSRQSFY
jgi:hypothetical protein